MAAQPSVLFLTACSKEATQGQDTTNNEISKHVTVKATPKHAGMQNMHEQQNICELGRETATCEQSQQAALHAQSQRRKKAFKVHKNWGRTRKCSAV
eukprot:233975-Rhodomonas_salina.1